MVIRMTWFGLPGKPLVDLLFALLLILKWSPSSSSSTVTSYRLPCTLSGAVISSEHVYHLAVWQFMAQRERGNSPAFYPQLKQHQKSNRAVLIGQLSILAVVVFQYIKLIQCCIDSLVTRWTLHLLSLCINQYVYKRSMLSIKSLRVGWKFPDQTPSMFVLPICSALSHLNFHCFHSIANKFWLDCSLLPHPPVEIPCPFGGMSPARLSSNNRLILPLPKIEKGLQRMECVRPICFLFQTSSSSGWLVMKKQSTKQTTLLSYCSVFS